MFTARKFMWFGLFLCASSFLALPLACRAQDSVLRADDPRPVTFEVVSVKPADPTGHGRVGFSSYPGGRVLVGQVTIGDLIAYAFDLQRYQVAGLPGWATVLRYDIEALKPAEAVDPKQHTESAKPSSTERSMLQTLLLQRFGLLSHRGTKVGKVYVLQRGKGPLAMVEAKDKTGEQYGGVFMKAGGIVDGEAAGKSITMAFLANLIGADLDRPVIERTGLTDRYDFHLLPEDKTNHDMTLAIFRDMERLGLKLTPGKAPVKTFMVEGVSKPTEN